MAPTGGQGQRAQAGIVAIAAVVLMCPFYVRAEVRTRKRLTSIIVAVSVQ